MYVWKEITPALACYLVNANWPWYPASDRDRWGRIVGLQWCNISVPIHVHVHTQTQYTSAQIKRFMWMHVDVFINPPNLSTMANLGFVPQMTLMHQMDCSAWVASHSGAICQIHTWRSFVFNSSFWPDHWPQFYKGNQWILNTFYNIVSCFESCLDCLMYC